MSPEQLLEQLERKPPAPVYLMLGPETWRRRWCRRALIERCLREDEREAGYIRHDLDELSLSEVIDDARSMSLFVQSRLIWVTSAESALPRGRGDDGEGKDGAAAALAEYVKDPTPGTVLVLDAAKYQFDGEDKAKSERVRRFYAAAPAVVEFPRFSAEEARLVAQDLAAGVGLRIGSAELMQLVDTTACDAHRLETEIEKLRLFRGEAKVTAEDIAALAPNGRETTVFALVNALARGDRKQSLDLLDTLVREGEYLPLALTFLSGLMRQAIAAKEQKLRGAQDVQNYFLRLGVQMWRSRAEQVWQAASRMPQEQLSEAVQLIFAADRDMKGSRPDDRLVMEQFVLKLTS